MSESGGHPTTGDPERRPGPLASPMTFIVRVGANEAGAVVGVVEHARTGRKERFEGLEAISRVIAALMRSAGVPDTGAGPIDAERPATT